MRPRSSRLPVRFRFEVVSGFPGVRVCPGGSLSSVRVIRPSLHRTVYLPFTLGNHSPGSLVVRGSYRFARSRFASGAPRGGRQRFNSCKPCQSGGSLHARRCRKAVEQ